MLDSYRFWRAAMYISGSYLYTIQDDVVHQSYSHSFTCNLGGELEEIFLGEKRKGEF